MAEDRLTIVFMPESAYGPTNNCVGIGKLLEQRGHRVVFAAEASWKGRLEPLGFEEDLVDLAPPPEDEEEQDAGQFWTDFITETAPEFRKPTIEQLSTFIEPVFSSLIDGATYCEPQLKAILDRAQPDVIVEDNVNAFPALLTSGAPWVRIMSCNPLEMKDPALPPVFSGYPIDDTTEWEAYRAEYERVHRPTWERYNAFVLDNGAPPLPDLEFIHESAHLNLSVYPEVADYPRSRALAPTWHRLESSVRDTEEPSHGAVGPSFAVPVEAQVQLDQPADIVDRGVRIPQSGQPLAGHPRPHDLVVVEGDTFRRDLPRRRLADVVQQRGESHADPGFGRCDHRVRVAQDVLVPLHGVLLERERRHLREEPGGQAGLDQQRQPRLHVRGDQQLVQLLAHRRIPRRARLRSLRPGRLPAAHRRPLRLAASPLRRHRERPGGRLDELPAGRHLRR
jgi:hypothetical protein